MPESPPSTSPPPSPPAPAPVSPPLRQRVEQVINMLRPFIQSDGGDLELLDVTDAGAVSVRLHGACVGCPSSSWTLRNAIEANLRQRVPEVTSVVAVEPDQ